MKINADTYPVDDPYAQLRPKPCSDVARFMEPYDCFKSKSTLKRYRLAHHAQRVEAFCALLKANGLECAHSIANYDRIYRYFVTCIAHDRKDTPHYLESFCRTTADGYFLGTMLSAKTISFDEVKTLYEHEMTGDELYMKPYADLDPREILEKFHSWSPDFFAYQKALFSKHNGPITLEADEIIQKLAEFAHHNERTSRHPTVILWRSIGYDFNQFILQGLLERFEYLKLVKSSVTNNLAPVLTGFRRFSTRFQCGYDVVLFHELLEHLLTIDFDKRYESELRHEAFGATRWPQTPEAIAYRMKQYESYTFEGFSDEYGLDVLSYYRYVYFVETHNLLIEDHDTRPEYGNMSLNNRWKLFRAIDPETGKRDGKTFVRYYETGDLEPIDTGKARTLELNRLYQAEKDNYL